MASVKEPRINIDVFLRVDGVLLGEASVLDTAWEALAVTHTALKVFTHLPVDSRRCVYHGAAVLSVSFTVHIPFYIGIR